MVQLEKVEGQRGHMVVQEDGTVLSSSGDLASSESTAQNLINLVQHAFPVNFSQSQSSGSGDGTSSGNPSTSTAGGGDAPSNGHFSLVNGDASSGGQGQVWKWNRVTIDCGDHSYIACLSNKRIHIVKRDNVQVQADGEQSS